MLVYIEKQKGMVYNKNTIGHEKVRQHFLIFNSDSILG